METKPAYELQSRLGVTVSMTPNLLCPARPLHSQPASDIAGHSIELTPLGSEDATRVAAPLAARFEIVYCSDLCAPPVLQKQSE